MTTARSNEYAIRVPGPVDPSETFRFASNDGTDLYGEFFAARDPRGAEPMTLARAAVVVAHGYFEHCGRYRELAHVLTRARISVLSYDMRGHGRSAGQRGHIGDIGEYLDDLAAALEELDRRVRAAQPEPEVPRFLLGHSNGGLVILRALCDPVRKPDRIAAAVLSSPFLGFGTGVAPTKDLIGRALGRLLPRLSLPNQLALDELTSDPEKQEERRLDTLCHDSASTRWYTCVLAAHDYVAEFAARIDVPTLWLVAADDRVADPAVSRAVRARLRTPSLYYSLAGMQHEVFNERERGRVFDRLVSCLQEMIRPDDNDLAQGTFARSRPPLYT
ncbi:MAG: lysophospholipase [Proteobacteria bacterium]|nr:lysophospholipase [Pseudomonadota bacterium]